MEEFLEGSLTLHTEEGWGHYISCPPLVLFNFLLLFTIFLFLSPDILLINNEHLFPNSFGRFCKKIVKFSWNMVSITSCKESCHVWIKFFKFSVKSVCIFLYHVMSMFPLSCIMLCYFSSAKNAWFQTLNLVGIVNDFICQYYYY